MESHDASVTLEDLPPSSKYIYTTLNEKGAMTLKELTEHTLLSSRTARYGLDQLEDAGLVTSSPSLRDGRQTCFSLADGVRGQSMSGGRSSVVVEPDWVLDRLEKFTQDDPDFRLIEADDEYTSGHIPGAVQVDVLEHLVDVHGCGIADKGWFEEYIGSCGVTPESTVVIYSNEYNQYAAYLYWLFKYYRHKDVCLLDGGKERWESLENPLTTTEPSVSETTYVAQSPDERIRAYRNDVERAISEQHTNMIDVRTTEEYNGQIACPPEKDFPAARTTGHVPGSVHLPWESVLDENGQFKSESELIELFQEHEIGPDERALVYCHVAERSSVVWFVLSELLEYSSVMNYDGSWLEWGSLIDVPVEEQ